MVTSRLMRRISDEENRTIGRLQLDASLARFTKSPTVLKMHVLRTVLILTSWSLNLETNGTIDPEESIRRAATILQQQMAVFVNLEGETAAEPEEKEEEIDPISATSG